MERHTLKIEVLAPTSIESEVPKQQILRAAENSTPDDNVGNATSTKKLENVSDGRIFVKEGDTVETYVPVIKVKTEETNFGKQGLKFQSLKVTEDVAVNFQHLFKKETKPGKTVVTQIQRLQKPEGLISSQWFFVILILEPVVFQGGPTEWTPRGLLRPVHVGEPVRPPPRVWRKAPEPPESLEDKNTNDKKTKTRIPVSRFKTAVDKVRRERRDSKEGKSKKQAPEKPPRKSSIPKLSDRSLAARKNAYKSQAEEQTDKTHDKESSKNEGKADRIPVPTRDSNRFKENGDENAEKTEKDTSSFKDEEKSITQVKEPLEDEFDKLYEEIVDKEVEIPDEILDTKVKDPEKLEIKFEEIVHQYDEKVKVEPADKARYSKIPLLKRRSEQEIKLPKQHERRLSLKTGNVAKVDKIIQSELTKNDIVKINVENEVNEADNIVKDVQKAIEINNNQNKDEVIEQHPSVSTPIYNVVPTPDAELVKVGIFHLDTVLEKHDKDNDEKEIEGIKVSTLDESTENNVAHVENNLESEEVKDSENKENPQVVNEDTDITQMDEPEVNGITENFITIENDSLTDSNISEDNAVILTQNDTVKVAVINFDNPADDEFKSVRLLRNVNSVEERTKSRFINKPVKKENDIKVNELEEDVPIVKGKVITILNRLNSQENTNNDINDANDKINDERESRKDDFPAKGNVSKILNRITSQDIEQNVRQEFNEIPKKRSVLSKIALFERPDLELIASKKPLPKYTIPQRTISEEMKHSPKIVHEVLKPSIRYGQTDKHEVVTIDILKPVEVVTNNEEQVLIVEDLKEKTIVYDNLDEAKVDENDKIKNEVSTELTIDENVLPKIDTTLPIEADKTVVENETNDHKFDAIDPTDNWKNREVVSHYVPVKEKIDRLKSYEEINIKRATSAAELDLGDTVKGKVKNMIYRMNSSEMLDEYVGNKQKETISIKERPRKRSVSEKIAMFEKKLTPVKMEAVDNARGLDIDAKPDGLNSLPDNTTLEEEYTAKIKALENARVTYGSINSTYMELSDGSRMPVLALGTALLDPRLAKYIVAAAIDLGFRAIDTAFIYGNEKEVGEGIRAKINDGTVKREELFIINKLWSTFHQPDLVEPACRASLRALGLDYFDLFMIHNPMSFKEGGDPLPKIANVLQFSSHDYLEAWFAMESLVPHVVRRIGVSNFNSAQLTRVLEKGRVAPVVNQVECHPYLNQQRLSDFCDARGVKLSCFGTLGSKGTPSEYKSSQAAVIDDPLVQVMAAGIGISSAQLLISYQLHCGHGVVVKGSSAAHLWDNLQAAGVSLSPAQIKAMHSLNRNKRTFTFKGMGDTHRNYPFKEPF